MAAFTERRHHKFSATLDTSTSSPSFPSSSAKNASRGRTAPSSVPRPRPRRVLGASHGSSSSVEGGSDRVPCPSLAWCGPCASGECPPTCRGCRLKVPRGSRGDWRAGRRELRDADAVDERQHVQRPRTEREESSFDTFISDRDSHACGTYPRCERAGTTVRGAVQRRERHGEVEVQGELVSGSASAQHASRVPHGAKARNTGFWMGRVRTLMAEGFCFRAGTTGEPTAAPMTDEPPPLPPPRAEPPGENTPAAVESHRRGRRPVGRGRRAGRGFGGASSRVARRGSPRIPRRTLRDGEELAATGPRGGWEERFGWSRGSCSTAAPLYGVARQHALRVRDGEPVHAPVAV